MKRNLPLKSAKRLAFILSFLLFILLLFTQPARPPQTEQTSAALKSEGLPLPIVMYHAVTDDEKMQNDYTVTPKTLADDFAAIKDAGFTPVLLSQVTDFVLCHGKLPKKPIVITFDDGFKGLYKYLPELLDEYDFAVNISIVGSYSEKAAEEQSGGDFSYLNGEEITSLFETGRVEIVNHSYAMHSLDGDRQGTLITDGEDYQSYRSAFLADIRRCQDFLAADCRVIPRVFAYPYGFHCDVGERVVKSAGFLCSLTCEERINFLSSDPDCLYNLGRFNRPSSVSSAEFVSRLS